jgi:hypothetical protein
MPIKPTITIPMIIRAQMSTGFFIGKAGSGLGGKIGGCSLGMKVSFWCLNIRFFDTFKG